MATACGGCATGSSSEEDEVVLDERNLKERAMVGCVRVCLGEEEEEDESVCVCFCMCVCMLSYVICVCGD
ncbi:hypothetical protein Hanom_Chr07g00639371 [Helianthus anomalus]